MAELQEEETQA
jgi:uncharacterized protein HemY